MLLIAAFSQLPDLVELVEVERNMSFCGGILGAFMIFLKGFTGLVGVDIELVFWFGQKHLSFLIRQLFILLSHALSTAAPDVWPQAVDKKYRIYNLKNVVDDRLMMFFLIYWQNYNLWKIVISELLNESLELFEEIAATEVRAIEFSVLIEEWGLNHRWHTV